MSELHLPSPISPFLSFLPSPSQPELGGNPVSLRTPNRPLSSSVAFLGHLGLNTVQKSKGNAKNPLNGARQWARAYIACPPPPALVPLAGLLLLLAGLAGARAGFSANRRG
jgi:hypothetical protein